MKLKILGSSSKGNCYILETDTGSLILDAGVRFPDIQKALNFDLSKVRGALLGHEHGDHSKSFKDLTKAGIDVYLSLGTFQALCPGCYPGHRAAIVAPGSQFNLLPDSDFTVLPFSVQHDAKEPLGFLIQYKPTGEKLVYLTDSYYSHYAFTGVNYFLIECNYCSDILKANIEAGLIPEVLKNRLLESHFSMENVKGFLEANDLSEVRKIVLIHLSDGNSDAARMVREITKLTGKDVEVAEAGKEIELELYPF